MLSMEVSVRHAMYGAGFLLMMLALTATVSAGLVGEVPEIDGGSLATGLGLLSGGLMILRSRLGAKRRERLKEY